MARRICVVCQKKIKMFQKLSSTHCFSCKGECHDGPLKSCATHAIDYQSFKKNEITKIYLCNNCVPEYQNIFGSQGKCTQCDDLFIIKNQWAQCEWCKKIGHGPCYKKNASDINGHLYWVYPYRHNFKEHDRLCFSCYQELDELTDYIYNKPSPIITQNNHVRGYDTIEKLAEVKTNLVSKPPDAKLLIEILAKQLEGNAVLNYWYEKCPYTVVVDSDTGYKRTEYEYCGTGLVVKIRRKR